MVGKVAPHIKLSLLIRLCKIMQLSLISRRGSYASASEFASRAFAGLDSDGNGYIDKAELASVLGKDVANFKSLFTSLDKVHNQLV